MKGRLTKVIYWGIIAIALIVLATQLYPVLKDFLVTEYQAILYPYSIDYGEGPLLDQTLRLASFENIYSNSLDKPPFTISNYPPLFPLIQVPLAWIFGPAFWYGRLLNLICVLMAALFITLTLHRLTRDWLGAIIAGLLLVAAPYVQHWAKFNRVDMLALAFSWAGIYFIVRSIGTASPHLSDQSATIKPTAAALVKRQLNNRVFILGSVLIVAAIFTRQTYALAPPAAVFFWLVFCSAASWKERLINAFLFGAVVFGLSLLLFLILNIATAGGFYLNIVVANVNSFKWQTVQHYGEEIADKLWPLLVLAGLFVILGWIGKSRGVRHTWALVLPYVLASTAGSVTIGKDGSNVNYLLELSAALCLAAGAVLAWTNQWQRRPVRLVLRVGIIGVLVYQCVTLQDWNQHLSVSYLKDQMLYRLNTERMVQMIKDAPGIVLADEYMGLVPLAGKRLYIQPFEFKAMSDANVWDQTPFLQDIASRKFDMILWFSSHEWKSIEGRWTAAQRSAINQYYTEDQLIGEVHVMAPRK